MKIKKLHENAKLPTRANPTDAGYDLYSVEDVFIPLGQTRIVKTGIAIELDPSDKLKFLKIEDRSSMAAKGLRTGAGVVDVAYRGEIGVVIHNLTAKDYRDPVLFEAGYRIQAGDKIAQGIIHTIEVEPVEWADQISTTDRGQGGFGSTGR